MAERDLTPSGVIDTGPDGTLSVDGDTLYPYIAPRDRDDAFGFEDVNLQRRRAAGVAQESFSTLDVRITSYKPLGHNRYRFALENGQIWESTQSRKLVLKAGQQMDAMIRKGLLGAYLLTIKGEVMGLRITRVQ